MQVGIIGGGTMGIGIAHAVITAGSSAFLVESLPAQAEVVSTRIEATLASGVQRGKITAAEKDAAQARLRVLARVEELPEELDWIIEAVPEDPKLKAEVLVQAEARRPKHFASNTSALSITKLSEALQDATSFVGMHFFNPVWSMRLVEVVVGSKSAPATVGAAEEFARILNKEPIVVKDAPGFASSRLGVLLGIEAIRMVEEQIASAEDIDKAMVLGYGYPMGPLRLGDLVGLDVRLAIATNLAKEYGERFAPPQLLIDMVAAGKLGKKSGEGFYRW